VLQNLIANGVKFRGKQTPQINIGVVPHDRFWRFSIQGNGIGIKSEYFEKIFALFQRLHGRSEYPGTGIAAWLSTRKWSNATPGASGWSQHPERALRFYFTLPMHPRPAL